MWVGVVLELGSGCWAKWVCASKNLKCIEETVHVKHVVFDKAAGEDLQESEVNVTGNWKKMDPCHVVADCLATVSPPILWKVKHVPDMI